MPATPVTPLTFIFSPSLVSPSSSTYNVTSLSFSPTPTALVDPTPDQYRLLQVINRLKALYNEHLEDPGVHVNNDTTNKVSTSDAVNFAQAAILLQSICEKFNDHRVEPEVHANLVTIRLEAPVGLRYKDIKFFRQETGTTGLMAPFSDDENVSLIPVPMPPP